MLAMKHPWANIVLLVLLPLQLLTGYLGFVNGLPRRAWILWLHGAGAYALLLLLAFKGQIIWAAWRRGTGWRSQRTAFVAQLLLLLVVLALGLVWTVRGPLYVFGFSLLTLHILLAVPLLALLAWHAWRMRFVLGHPATRGRRAFLRGAGIALGGLALYPLTAGLRRLRRFTGSYETGSFTGRFPQVSWIADHPPPVDVSTWRLAVTGAVERPVTFDYEALLAAAAVEVTATLDCTGGWYSTQVWRGVALRELLAAAGPLPAAASITVRAVSGYFRRFSLAEAEALVLALAVAGEPLSHGHGFPARLVAPRRRGFNWVKWVSEIEVNRTPAALQPPLPLS